MADLGKEDKVGGGCEKEEEKEEEEERLIEGVSVLDFDVLCSTVAMQSQGKWRLFDNKEEGEEEGVEYGGGVFRMWEGEVLDCFDDRRIAIESFCCPCYRFGKNMRHAGLGPCFLQGVVYFLLAISVFLSCAAFIVTRKRCFLYLAIALTISVGIYLGFFRTRMRKKFNIRGTDNSVDDCVNHLICPCCTLCQILMWHWRHGHDLGEVAMSLSKERRHVRRFEKLKMFFGGHVSRQTKQKRASGCLS